MKKIFIPIMLLVLASCGSTTSTDSTSSSSSQSVSSEVSISLNPVESLNSDETHIYKVFIAFVTADEVGFHNPSVARVTEVGQFRTLENTDNGYITYGWKHLAQFKLRGTNSLGGTVTNTYGVFVDDNWVYKTHSTNSVSYLKNSLITTTNIGNINRAIAHYWSELGL